MSQDLSHIGPVLRRYMPATSMFNMSGQPAMSVPLAWSSAGQLEQECPWRDRRPPICA